MKNLLKFHEHFFPDFILRNSYIPLFREQHFELEGMRGLRRNPRNLADIALGKEHHGASLVDVFSAKS